MKSSLSLSNTIKVKLKRNRKAADLELTDDLIRKQFSKFGPILSIVTKKKSALLEYEKYESLKKIAINCPENFEFEILNVNTGRNYNNNNYEDNNDDDSDTSDKEKRKPIRAEPIEEALPTVATDDYEEYIMRRMQEAQQKKN